MNEHPEHDPDDTDAGYRDTLEEQAYQAAADDTTDEDDADTGDPQDDDGA